jgi:hypothetical protein
MRRMILPIIHLNGTSRESLVDDACTARSALESAIEALCQMRPNGRDYYPAPGTLGPATDEHEQRIQAVRRVSDELTEWAQKVMDME